MEQHDTPTSKQVAYDKPLPRLTPLNEGFWRYTRQSILAVQVCSACGDSHIPEAPVCPRCLAVEQAWQSTNGMGTLESWADFHRAYWDGFKEELPYRTCLVRLDEGPLIISNLVGGQAGIHIGARVRAVFDRVSEEIVLPKFALDDGGEG
jgi:uncharacterized OB-fold protein